MATDKEYIFGVADITIGKGEDQIKFDGKDYLQAEGGTLSLEPQYEEITFEDFGETVVEHRLSGWEGTMTIVAGQEDVEILQLALASTERIKSTDADGKDGAMDAPLGTPAKGRHVNIHPRNLPKEVKDMDWNVYNMASIGGFEREYAQEQGNISIELTMMPREGFDASKPGNFFYRGGTDPHGDEDGGNDDDQEDG